MTATATQNSICTRGSTNHGEGREILLGSIPVRDYYSKTVYIPSERDLPPQLLSREGGELVNLQRRILDGHSKLISQADSVPYRVGLILNRGLIGFTPAMREVYRLIATFAGFPDIPVIITGRTGTGKAEAARGIHYSSERGSSNIQEMNCGCHQGQLALSDLFGHVKGAFTGADTPRVGFIQAADSSTLVLDEICQMEPATQAKMLNCFDRYGIVRYTPVGATNQETSHVRFVATTNVPLAELVETGRMRQDFKERIDVFRLNMPSLNAEDVPILAYHFFRQLALQYGPDVEISVGAVRHLQRKFWPGNARQLHHEITRGFARMQDGVLHAGDLVDETDAHTGDRAAQINQGDFYLATLQSLGNLSDREFAEFSAKHGGLYAASDLFERAMIERALRMRIKTNRMQSIANILDVNRTTLYKKMLEYGLTKDPIDEGGSADQIISIHSQGAAPDDSKGNKPNRKAATA